MKGYTMKSSPFKQAETGETNAADEAIRNSQNAQYIVGPNGELGARTTKTVVTPGEDTFVEGTPDVITGPTEIFTGKKATGAAAEKWAKQNEYCKGKPKGTPGCSGFHKYEGGATEAGTPDKTVKGKDKVTEVPSDKKIYRKVEGEASTAYESRNNLRRMKQAARKQKRAAIKEGRLDAKLEGLKDKDGAKKRRLTAKKAQATANKAAAAGEVTSAQAQIDQGKTGFSNSKSYRLEDVVDTAGSLTREEQLRAGKSAAKMKNTGFFKKKSPMKMNYFKK